MTVLVKVTGVAKELMVAWKFGTGDEIEAFLMALLVPTFAINVVASSFNAALIPTYIRVREGEGVAASGRLLSGVMVWSLGLLGITTILILATAPVYLPLLARGFSPEKLDLTFRLLWAIAPLVLLSGAIAILGAVLNAGERFALAALSPSISPVLAVLFLLIAQSWGIYALVAGLICGAVLELLILAVALQRQGISLLPKWYGFDDRLRQVAGQYVPMMAGAFLMGSTNIVDRSMAAMLSPGSVAALNYGNRLINLPLGLAATALGTAVIPYFSRMVACQDWQKLQQTLNQYLKLIFLLTVPFTVLIIIISTPLVQVIFQRGAFTTESTQIVAEVQTYYALQIPFYISGILVVRLISSLQANHILMWASLCNLVINIILNYLFMQWLGVAGIALSTACVYLFSFSFVSFSLKGRLVT